MPRLLIRIIFFVTFLLPYWVWGATYYIDPTCSTSGTGTSQTCNAADGPFKTWAEVTWAAGNTYSQKGGTTASEVIRVTASGTEGNVITLNSYGTGNAILDGGVIIASGSWTGPDGNGVYSMTAFGRVMLEDGVFLKQCAVANCASGTGNWDFNSPNNYYKPTSGVPSDHVVKKFINSGTGDSYDGVAIHLAYNDFITITGFTFNNYRYGVYGATASGQANSNITIIGNTFTNCQFGVWLNTRLATSQSNAITNNVFDYIQSSIEFSNGPDGIETSGSHNAINISNNTISHCGQVWGTSAYDWSGVDAPGGSFGWDLEAIGTQGITNSSIYLNSISGSCRGLTLFILPGADNYSNNFYRNYINTSLEPIYYAPDFATSPYAKSFHNNNLYSNVLIYAGSAGSITYGAITIDNIPVPNGTYNTIYNNTIIGTGTPSGIHGIYVKPNTDYYKIENNIFYETQFSFISEVESPANMVIDYNIYYTTGTPRWIRNDTSVWIWADWKAFGYDTNSLTPPADPLFTNAVGGVYTLTILSPAIDKGVNVGLTLDYEGNSIPKGAGFDIGAYEFLGVNSISLGGGSQKITIGGGSQSMSVW